MIVNYLLGLFKILPIYIKLIVIDRIIKRTRLIWSDDMEFLTIGEKLRNLRKQLNLDQDDITKIGISRNYISMIENNKRELNKKRASEITKLLKDIALEKNINVIIDDNYLIRSPKQDAEEYCLNILSSRKNTEEVSCVQEIINKYELDSIQGKFHLILADICFVERDYTKAFIYYLDALDQYKNLKDYNEVPYIYNRLGRCRDLKLDYHEALSYFLKAYEASIIYNKKEIKKIALYNISWANLNLDNLKDALHYINIYLELCNIEETFNDYVRAIILKADCYNKMQQIDNSLQLYLDVIKLFQNPKDSLLGFIYNNLGELNMKRGHFDQSLQYFNKAELLRQEVDISRIPYTLIDKAKLYIHQDEYNKALIEVVQAVAYSKSFKDNESLYKGYLVLETIYIRLKDKEKLKQTYIDMITLFNDNSDKYLVAQIYAKLSILSIEDNNIDRCLNYLKCIINIQNDIGGNL